MNVFLWNARARNTNVEATLNHQFPAQVLEFVNNARLQGITFIYDLGNIGDEAMAQLSLRLTPQLAHRHEPIVRESHFGNDLYIMSSRPARREALGRFPLVSAECSSSDHLSERSRSVDVFFSVERARARGTPASKRR